MEGEKRKRKLENINEEESDDEEEKLEKFYALLRSTKDVRNLLANSKEKTDKDDFIEKDKGIWRPTFQPEDFIDDYQQGIRTVHDSSNPSVPSPSTSAKHDDVVLQVADKQPPQATAPPPPPQIEDDGDNNDKADDHLDLNLSL